MKKFIVSLCVAAALMGPGFAAMAGTPACKACCKCEKCDCPTCTCCKCETCTCEK